MDSQSRAAELLPMNDQDALCCLRREGLVVADLYRRAGTDIATYMSQLGHSIRIALRD